MAGDRKKNTLFYLEGKAQATFKASLLESLCCQRVGGWGGGLAREGRVERGGPHP